MNHLKKSTTLNLYRFALRYGLIIGVIPATYNTLLYAFNLLMEYYGDDPGGSMKLRTYIFILPICIILAIYRFKKKKNGLLKFREALLIGLEIAVISALVMISYHLFFNTFLAPSFHQTYYNQYSEALFKELVDCCDYTLTQFEEHKNLRIRYDEGKGYLGDLVTSISTGALFASIAGLIMRKKVKRD